MRQGRVSVAAWLRGTSPVSRGALAGLLAGIAVTGGLLVALDGRFEGESGWQVRSLLFYLSLPVGAMLRSAWELVPTPDGWWSPYARSVLVAGPILNAPLLGAAGVACVRKLRSSRAFRRIFAGVLALEGALIALLAVVGLASPFGGAGLASHFASLAHEPGIFLLVQLGLCCGYFNHTVISDWWGGPVQHPTLFGLAHLAVANAFMLLLIAGCAPAALQWVRRRRAGPFSAA
jgi:hypothetical protein